MFKRCSHEYRPTKGKFRDNLVGECCKNCGAPRVYPEGFSYAYRLNLISKNAIVAWGRLGNAVGIVDWYYGWLFLNSFFAGLVTLIVMILLPVLFPFYPLFALWSYIHKRRWLRGQALEFFHEQDVYANHRKLDDD